VGPPPCKRCMRLSACIRSIGSVYHSDAGDSNSRRAPPRGEERNHSSPGVAKRLPDRSNFEGRHPHQAIPHAFDSGSTDELSLEGACLKSALSVLLCPCWIGEDPTMHLRYHRGVAFRQAKGGLDVTGPHRGGRACPGNILQGNWRAAV